MEMIITVSRFSVDKSGKPSPLRTDSFLIFGHEFKDKIDAEVVKLIMEADALDINVEPFSHPTQQLIAVASPNEKGGFKATEFLAFVTYNYIIAGKECADMIAKLVDSDGIQIVLADDALGGRTDDFIDDSSSLLDTLLRSLNLDKNKPN